MTHPTSTTRSRGRKLLVAGGAAVAAVALVALLVRADTGASRPPGGMSTDQSSEAIPDAAVQKALGDDCRQLLNRGSAKGPQTVVVLDRTGRLASAQLPGVVLDRLRKTATGDPDELGSVSLVTVGGNGDDTHVVADRAALMDPSAGSGRQDRIADGLPACLDRLMGAAPAPALKGSDVLFALQQGARLAQSAHEGGSRDVHLYWVTDGEANHGLLDLRTQGFPGDPAADAVRRVAKSHNLPRLDGLDIELIGLGQDLPEAERTWLEDFYTGLCVAAQGSCTVSSEQIPTGAAGDPDGVSPRPDDPAISALRSVPGAPPGTVAIDPAAFAANSTELVDPASVATALRPLRDDLASGVLGGAAVVGHACDDGSPPEGLEALSLARARTIKRLLVDGRPELDAVVTVAGVGADEPVPVPAGTTPDQRCAAQRTVVITPR